MTPWVILQLRAMGWLLYWGICITCWLRFPPCVRVVQGLNAMEERDG